MAELIPNDAPDEGEQPRKKKRKGQGPRNYIRETREWLTENFDMRKNVHTREVYFREKGDGEYRTFTTEERDDLWETLNEMYIKISPDSISRLTGNKRTPLWNPIEDYLKSLPERQGFSAIRRLAGSLELAKAEEKIKLSDGRTISYELACEMLLRRWLIGCVACGLGRNPNHVCLVLVGAQRKYKTTWLNRLCPSELPDYRFTGHIEPTISTGETPNLLAEKFWLNIDDQLEVIFRKDFNAMKSLITVDEITNRKPYMPKAERRRRIANIVASVNSTDFLTDVENRRYLCIEVEMCHISKMPDIDQVWAEAYTAFNEGERYYMNAEEYEMLNAMTSNYTLDTLEQQWLRQCYRPPTNEELPSLKGKGFTSSEILQRLITRSKMPGLQIKQLGMALRQQNFPRGNDWRRQIGKSLKVYWAVELPDTTPTQPSYQNQPYNDNPF